MQFNQATDYAFRVVLYLAYWPEGTIIRGTELALKQNIPTRFLLKIMRSLMEGGLVKSFRGVEGGYALTRKPKEISLYDVIEAMEGPIVIQRCLHEPNNCTKQFGTACPVHQTLKTVQATFIDQLQSIDFATLVHSEGGKMDD
jgi:Rrf2 family protein